MAREERKAIASQRAITAVRDHPSPLCCAAARGCFSSCGQGAKAPLTASFPQAAITASTDAPSPWALGVRHCANTGSECKPPLSALIPARRSVGVGTQTALDPQDGQWVLGPMTASMARAQRAV